MIQLELQFGELSMDNVTVSFSINKQKLTSFRVALSALLAETTCRIHYEKTDGTDAEMKCTLRDGLIPKEAIPKGTGKVNYDTLPVYKLDGDKPGWRSFRVDSVKNVEVMYE